MISIIIPIYKVEKYLERCIESVLNQTYNNLEIILVDDGSPDSCGLICDKYREKDTRIKVIHKTNGGLSSARNAGIEIASGDYYMFVDSDDYIHADMVEKLLEAVKTFHLKLGYCGFYSFTETEEIVAKAVMSEEKVIHKRETLIEMLYEPEGQRIVTSWNKIYDKSLFETLRFPEGKIHEDEFIIHRVLDQVDQVIELKAEYYNYLQRKDSIVGKQYNIKRLDRLDAYLDRYQFYEALGDKTGAINAYSHYLAHLIGDYKLIKEYVDNNKDIRKRLRNDFNEHYKKLIPLMKTGNKDKLALYHYWRRRLKFLIYKVLFIFI